MATDSQDHARTLGFVWRVEMALDLRAPLPDPELPAGYQFAPFTARHVEELAALEHAAFAGSPDALAFAQHLATPDTALAAWRQLLRSRRFDRHATLLAMRGDELCGFVQASRAPRAVGYLTSVAVARAHRGGLGRALVVEALHRFQDGGLRHAALTVTASNTAALGLYERLGFEEVGWSITSFAPGR